MKVVSIFQSSNGVVTVAIKGKDVVDRTSHNSSHMFSTSIGDVHEAQGSSVPRWS